MTVTLTDEVQPLVAKVFIVNIIVVEVVFELVIVPVKLMPVLLILIVTPDGLLVDQLVIVPQVMAVGQWYYRSAITYYLG